MHHANRRKIEAATVDSLFSVAGSYGDRLTFLTPPKPVNGGFSGATVLKANCHGGDFAIRGWPEGTDLRRVRGLRRLLAHVAAGGVPVAVPLPNKRGETVTWHANRWWQVEPWLPGCADFHDVPTDAKLDAALATLAAFHAATSTFRALPDDAEWFGGPMFGAAPSVRDRSQLLAQLADRGAAMIRKNISPIDHSGFAQLARHVMLAFDRLAITISGELRHGESLTVPLIPVLRDVWHDHILFTQESVTGLIDPSACRRDTVAADLSRLLGSFVGDNHEGWRRGMEAYERHRSLTDAERTLMPILDRSGVLLSAMTWLRRHYLFDIACDTPAVVARLRAIVERLDKMS
ncbi:MAG: phosphotransferase [Planctomycetota bacterium]|nr:phosphotransferase [Planctomycetota bacterium]